MGNTFLWSDPLPLPVPKVGERGQKKKRAAQDYIRIELPNSQGTGADHKDNGIIMCMKTQLNENNNLEVFVYSKYVNRREV